LHHYVYCDIIYNSQDMEAAQVFIHRYKKKMDSQCHMLAKIMEQ